MDKETRSAFLIEDVKRISLFNVNAQKAPGAALFHLKNVEAFRPKESRSVKDRSFDRVSEITF